MKFKIIIAIITISILLSACSSISQYTNIFGSSSSSSGKGFIVSFSQAPQSGAVLTQFDTFSITLDLSNYIVAENPIFAKVCLRDSASDLYGGIKGKECKEVTVAQAEQVNKNFFPGNEQLRFPEKGFYRYENLDRISIDNNQISADIYYQTKTEAGAIACVSMSQNSPKNCLGQQKLSVQQQESPVKISNILITPNAVGEDELRLNLEITLSKDRNTEVYKPSNSLGSVNSENEGVKIDINAKSSSITTPVSCRGISQGIVEFKKDQNEKIIKCTASVRLSQEFENVPIIVDLEYQVHKTIDGPKFTLRREEET